MLKLYILSIFLVVCHSSIETIDCDELDAESLKRFEQITSERKVYEVAEIYLKFNHLKDEHEKESLRLLSQIENLKSEIRILNESIFIVENF